VLVPDVCRRAWGLRRHGVGGGRAGAPRHVAFRRSRAASAPRWRLFGLGQSKAHQWIHVLLVVLGATLRALGDAPTRSVTELAQRLGVAEADASAMVVPTPAPPLLADPPAAAPAPAPASLPFGHDGTERRIERPQDPTEQTRCYSGKKKCLSFPKTQTCYNM
jgi:hypothetical protein